MTDRLYRSRRDRMLAGVAGGLAEMWDADPSLVRIVWALLVIFTGGIALVVYIVMAIVVPEEDSGAAAWSQWPSPPQPPPGAAPAPDVPGEAQAPEASAPGVAGASATAAAGASGNAASPPPAWTPPYSSRDPARAARHEARAARRSARNYNGGAIIGVILVGLGLFFLAREWLPQLDFDWFGPLVLVGVGVVLLVSALGRRPDDPGGTS